jgi:DNA-directed RNA polymerase subunit RPC12/RpoP
MKPRWYRARPASRPDRDAFDAACERCGKRTPVRIGTSRAEFEALRASGCPRCSHGASPA